MMKTPSDRNLAHRECIMAIGAHADDIEIQVGGTLEKYFRLGFEIVYVQSTNNMSGRVSTLHPDGSRTSRAVSTTEILPIRKRECDAAAREWNTTPIHLDHPQRHYTDDHLQQVELRYGCPRPATVPGDVPSILTAGEDGASIERLKNLILDKNPEVIFTHGVAQENPEHFCTALLVARAFWEAASEGFKGALLLWREHHTLFGPMESRWDTFVDYTPYFERKMELIGKHNCQMPHWMLPEFGHRTVSREFGKAAGVGAAEVFTWVRSSTHVNATGPVHSSLMMELLNNNR